jgi:hypothetical protein
VETDSKFNQAPDDIFINYSQDQFQRKRRRQNEALGLEKFMNKAGRLMEKMIEQI